MTKKIKSKSSFGKRFHLTSKGKLKRWSANSSHLFYPGKKKSGLRKTSSLLDKSDLKRFRKVYKSVN